MRPDPVIDEIRRIRHEISSECGHDPRRLFEHYRQLQRELGDRVVSFGESTSSCQLGTFTKTPELPIPDAENPSPQPGGA